MLEVLRSRVSSQNTKEQVKPKQNTVYKFKDAKKYLKYLKFNFSLYNFVSDSQPEALALADPKRC